MNEIFNAGFVEHLKIFFVAILIYAIVYALLKKLSILGENSKIDSLIALMTAVIVSFSGIASYSISYAINWFVIIFFILFLLMMVLMFLGVSMGDVTKTTKDNIKPILIAFVLLFGIILVKSFFALNNLYDTSNPQEDQYAINTSFNTGVDDMASSEGSWGIFESIDPDLISAALFLTGIGIFIMILGK